jgi:hypothetical protein
MSLGTAFGIYLESVGANPAGADPNACITVGCKPITLS